MERREPKVSATYLLFHSPWAVVVLELVVEEVGVSVGGQWVIVVWDAKLPVVIVVRVPLTSLMTSSASNMS